MISKQLSNIPQSAPASDLGANAGRISTRSGVKKNKKVVRQPLRRSGRIPLKELSWAEVLLRDEAKLGDLRRRRASGSSAAIVEGDSLIVDVSGCSPCPVSYIS